VPRLATTASTATTNMATGWRTVRITPLAMGTGWSGLPCRPLTRKTGDCP
jgi:hypothetical protein